GGLIAFAGMAVIGSARLAGARFQPFLLVVAAAFFWGSANVLPKTAGRVDMLAFTVWSSLPVPLFLLSLAVQGASPLTVLAHPIPKLALSVLVLAYAGTLFGFGLWARLLAHYSAAIVTPFALLVPIVVMIAGWLVFGEPLQPVELFGGVLVLAGLALNVFGDWMLPHARPLSGDFMHDIKAIRDNPAAFDEGLARRGLPPRAESLIALDERRRAAIAELQRAQERRNAASKQIGAAMARKDTVAAEDYRAEVAGLKATMPELEAAEREASAALETALAEIPNLPFDDVPDGRDENDNVEVRRHGAPPEFPEGFTPKEH